MSTLSAKYAPGDVESKWYKYWMDNKMFASKPDPDKESYTIIIPPPNVTGILHMGHMLNNTLQDVLIRKARMEGKEACWLPGTDHASIATEAKVVRYLREQGIKKSDLEREKFMEHAWEWKEKYGGIILEQLKKVGASCDWDRTAFTMDDNYYKAVIKVFVDLYKKGYIYRGLRMINWDCEAQTALSNEEVIYREDGENATLYSLRYAIEGSENEYITIATVRPETIMGDAAIAVNPNDPRYQHLIGKKALVPFINRPIPIIEDSYVDIEFGTGCLKITPAHDPNDYEIGQRHNLEVYDTINNDGTLNEVCGIEKFVGKDRFVVRKEITKDLKEAGYLVGTEDFITKIGRSERTDTVVEPKLSLQWFIKMKEISKTALEAVENDEITLHPAKFKNVYRHWMENVRDWCISRQLWWGQRIPAYFFGEGENDFVVAESIEEAIEMLHKEGKTHIKAEDLKQDEDVLDTWASSWLWPTATFDGFSDEVFDREKGKIVLPDDHELKYYYPSAVLVTAPEILFFWVARMIIAGYEYMDEKPFKDVYLTGIVRDKLGRKMSKSLGNSPDPLDLIKEYGADAVRTGMLFASPAGNDLLFDVKLCEQGRNFANKIWNAFRLVDGWEVSEGAAKGDKAAIDWFEAKLNSSILEIEDHFNKFRISDALMTTYKLIWDDYCSWYLEMVKPSYGDPIHPETLSKTVSFFEDLMKLLHPFMPFLTEELWHALNGKSEENCVIKAQWPIAEKTDTDILSEGIIAFDIISQVRNFRNQKNIKPKEELKLNFEGRDYSGSPFAGIIEKLAVLGEFSLAENQEESPAFIIKGDKFFIPVEGLVDKAEEKNKLEKELLYIEGFKSSIMKKLSNERFVNNAPENVIANERKKLEDADAKISAIQEALSKL